MTLFGEIKCNDMTVDFGAPPPTKENTEFRGNHYSASDKIKNISKSYAPFFCDPLKSGACEAALMA